MVLPPRELLFRLVFWGGVFVWAIWKIQDFSMRDVAVPDFLGMPLVTTGPVELPRPEGLTPAAADDDGDAAHDAGLDLVDPAAAVATMDATLSAAAPCGSAGELTVTLGTEGLVVATIDTRGVELDANASACLARAVWGATWPRSAVAFELSGTLGR